MYHNISDYTQIKLNCSNKLTKRYNMKYCNLYKKDSDYDVRNNIDEFDVQLEMMANTPTLY